jgi:hypothetical protein
VLVHSFSNQIEYNIYITISISFSIGLTFRKLIKRIEELRHQITSQSKDLPLSSDLTTDSAPPTYAPPPPQVNETNAFSTTTSDSTTGEGVPPPPQVNETYAFNNMDEDILHQQKPSLGDSDRDIKIDKFELERKILELEIRIKELEIKKKILEIKLCKLNET